MHICKMIKTINNHKNKNNWLPVYLGWDWYNKNVFLSTYYAIFQCSSFLKDFIILLKNINKVSPKTVVFNLKKIPRFQP